MAGIMKTLWDESSELENETLTPRSVMSDDYTTGDVADLQETIEDHNPEKNIVDDIDDAVK